MQIKKQILFLFVFSFFILVILSFVSAACVVPTDGMSITKNTVLCKGTYYLPNGLFVKNLNSTTISVSLDCNGSKLIGDKSISNAAGIAKGPYYNSDQNNYYELGPIIIKNCDIRNYAYGLYIFHGYNDVFSKNTISNTSLGAFFDYSFNENFTGNIFKNNNLALDLYWHSSNFLITGNDFINNEHVFDIEGSFNKIYLNNFINNKLIVAFSNTNNTIWTYSNKGNYWSNYDSATEGCFDNNNDGVCDVAYTIDLKNKDNYPLVSPVSKVINCTTNSQCGVSIWQSNNFCKNNVLWDTWKKNSCKNAGTPLSFCASENIPKIIQNCPYGCSNNACKIKATKNELALWNPTNGKWYIRDAANTKNILWDFAFGAKGMIPVSGDYDGDGKSDLGLWNPSDGKWYVYSTAKKVNLVWGVAWGSNGMRPVSGDYDGDGKDDLALWEPTYGRLYIRNAANTKTLLYNQPVPGYYSNEALLGDLNGDGKSDLAMWWDTNAKWWAVFHNGSEMFSDISWGFYKGSQYSTYGMTPVSGDYDGDGKDDLALWSPYTGKWYIRSASPSRIIVNGTSLGSYGMVAVSGDYNYDGKDDLAVWNPTDGKWYVKDITGKFIINGVAWGSNGMIPVSWYSESKII